MSNLVYSLYNGPAFVEFERTQQFEQLLGELGVTITIKPWCDVTGYDSWGCEIFSQVGLRYDLA